MKIKNKIVVKKSSVIIGIIACAAILVFAMCSLMSKPRDLTSIPEWEEFYNLGVSNYKTGSYQTAITAFKIAIDIDNTHPEAYLLAADAYLQLDQVKKAREILKIGIDATENEALRLKYEEVMAMPDPIEPEILPPVDIGSDGDEEDADNDIPEEDLKSSQLTNVF